MFISPSLLCFTPAIAGTNLLLCRFDESIKFFPVGFVKMVFIHLQFYLMPAAGYFSRYFNKPINKGPVFLFFKLAFLLAHHQRQIVSQNIQLSENVVCPELTGHLMAFYLFYPCFAGRTLLIKFVQFSGIQVEIACIADVLVSWYSLTMQRCGELPTVSMDDFSLLLYFFPLF